MKKVNIVPGYAQDSYMWLHLIKYLEEEGYDVYFNYLEDDICFDIGIVHSLGVRSINFSRYEYTLLLAPAYRLRWYVPLLAKCQSALVQLRKIKWKNIRLRSYFRSQWKYSINKECDQVVSVKHDIVWAKYDLLVRRITNDRVISITNDGLRVDAVKILKSFI